jgi:hypothetical protein
MHTQTALRCGLDITSPDHSFAVTGRSQHMRQDKRHFPENGGNPVAQFLVSWLLDGGRFRIHAVNGIGRRKGRIIEVEVVATGEHFYGSARKMERLVRALQGSKNDLRHDTAWTPGGTSRRLI